MMTQDTSQITILVCQGSGCLSSNSDEIKDEFEDQIKNAGLQDKVRVSLTGCHGFCAQGPTAIIEPEGIIYCKLKVAYVNKIVTSHLKDNKPVEEYCYIDPSTNQRILKYQDIPFYSKQTRMILNSCGYINPENIDEYIEKDGYIGLKKALEMAPDQAIQIIKKSGLRGRGGGGFPTGLKWAYCRESPGNEKYIICNADEGDPGAFMDRSILEADPHCVIEGMLIGAYAIGATHGYIYVRAEYPLAVKRFRHALGIAREKGYLGDKILNLNFSFDISVYEAAGAYIVVKKLH